jgi:hypothetical protein
VTLEIYRLTQKENWNLDKLFRSSRDPRLIRVLLLEAPEELDLVSTQLRKRFRKLFEEGREYRVLSEIQTLARHGANWFLNQNGYLNWREVDGNPENWNFGALSSNPFHRDPFRIQEFLSNSLRFFWILQKLKASERNQNV